MIRVTSKSIDESETMSLAALSLPEALLLVETLQQEFPNHIVTLWREAT